MDRLVCVLFLGILTVLVTNVEGLGQYRDLIPNGHRVSHPCKANFLWNGVGHLNIRGGGTNNQFGLDFVAQNKQWTTALCQMDSDNDGFSNGQELGDPNCVWSVGQVPERRDQITHPGICTPYESALCQARNLSLDCSTEIQECPGFRETGVQSRELKFPKIPVPAEETVYMCMVFDFPDDKDYHVIGSLAQIDNDNVMHHIIVYGCDESADTPPSEPYRCYMNPGYSCSAIIGGWTLGDSGDCMPDNVGILMGKSGYKRIALEYHWNNPLEVSGWEDATGVTIFYTEQLRPNNGGTLTVGQNYLAIPPRTETSTFTSTCSSDCTDTLIEDRIYITSASNHMHYLGKSASLQLWRNGRFIRNITNEPVFNYDQPQYTFFDPPQEVFPGDELITTCTFRSTDTPNWVYWGDGTQDEMCYVFVSFYPIENMPQPTCIDYQDMEICGQLQLPVIKDGCDVGNFLTSATPAIAEIYGNVLTQCGEASTCTDDCEFAVRQAREHPCLRGGPATDFLVFIMDNAQSPYAQALMYALEICGGVKTTTLKPGPYPSSATHTLPYVTGVMMLSLSAMI